MTCLYCGKKLGFFSRYKDTPFCSEEHLRSHQDEMERALMERLGSKISASSGQKELTREEELENQGKGRGKQQPVPQFDGQFDAPLPSSGMTSGMTGREDEEMLESLLQPKITRQNLGESPIQRGVAREFRGGHAGQNESQPELPIIPASERPIDKRAFMEGRAASPPPAKAREREKEREESVDASSPAPLCEDFFEEVQRPEAALEVDKPWFAPSSFAIIVQADFCTPSLGEVSLSAAPRMVEEGVDPKLGSIAPDALASAVEQEAVGPVLEFVGGPTELPKASGSQPSGMPTIASLAGEAATDIWDAFPAEETMVPLSFASENKAGEEPTTETVSGLASQVAAFASVGAELMRKPLGERPEVPMRPRHRYPYAASELKTRWSEENAGKDPLSFTHAEEWDGIEPEAYRNPLVDKIAESPGEIAPNFNVQLSLGALAAKTLRSKAEESFERDPAGQAARHLDAAAGLFVDSQVGVWASRLDLPKGSSGWQPSFRFPNSRPARAMAGVRFPSLYQLGPVLPPKPEGGSLSA